MFCTTFFQYVLKIVSYITIQQYILYNEQKTVKRKKNDLSIMETFVKTVSVIIL